ncbi:MAG TPA: hypothetical protein VF375_03920 [Candidatus Limnocylindrales bacterium]
MFAQGDLTLAGNAVDFRADFGTPALSALTAALDRLIAASDAVAEAVRRHDRMALVSSNEQADALVGEVHRLDSALTDEERALLGAVGISALCERLGACGRRNALLIEQAWATDAALMRLLVGIGKIGPDSVAGVYGDPPTPTYVDRQA